MVHVEVTGALYFHTETNKLIMANAVPRRMAYCALLIGTKVG